MSARHPLGATWDIKGYCDVLCAHSDLCPGTLPLPAGEGKIGEAAGARPRRKRKAVSKGQVAGGWWLRAGRAPVSDVSEPGPWMWRCAWKGFRERATWGVPIWKCWEAHALTASTRVAGQQDLLASGGREGRVLAGGAHVPHRVAHRSSEGRRGLDIGSGGEAGHRWGAPVLTNDEAAAALSQCRHGGQMEDSGLEAWGVVRGAGLMLARGGHPGAPPVLLGRPPRRS